MHFVAALDRVDGMRCVLGLFEGCRDRRGRRLLPDDGFAGLHASPSWSGPLQRIGEPAQCQEGVLRHRQHRRPACHLPHRAQCAADIRYRGPRAPCVVLGPDFSGRDVGRARRGGRDRGGQRIARTDRDLDSSGRHGLERSRRDRAGRPIPGPAEVRASAVDDAARILQSGEPTLLLMSHRALREDGLALAERIAGRTGCRVMGAVLQSARCARCRSLFGGSHTLRPGPGVGRAEEISPRHPGRSGGSGGLLRLSRQAEPAEAGRLQRADALRGRQ